MAEMATKQKVTKREYNRWVKWLIKRGYSGPFAGLTTKHECVRLSAKELRKVPPTIPETCPRDPRTIASNLDRYERAKGRLRGGKRELEIAHGGDSQLNLPSWVNQAQWEHLEGREYPGGLGIRQQLELLTRCFSDIDARSSSFWRPLDENVITQLRGHLPDVAFWSMVEDFSEKAGECERLLGSAYKRFNSAGQELAPLEPLRGPTPEAYITSRWAHRGLVRALNPELGLGEAGNYYHHKLRDRDFTLQDEEVIYRGPDDVAAEKKHRQAVDDFRNSQEFTGILDLMKQLRDLRQQILARINQCLRRREYSVNYCSDCPAKQASKTLASEK